MGNSAQADVRLILKVSIARTHAPAIKPRAAQLPPRVAFRAHRTQHVCVALNACLAAIPSLVPCFAPAGGQR